jgi:DNA-binding beta-propeller fold protein YncE
VLAGCSQRDRANPLDPQNPNSRGAPTGFNAVAGYLTVRLNWDARPDLAIDGFVLHRLAAGDSLYRPLGGLLPPNSSTFLDSGVPNRAETRYRLYFVNQGALSAAAAEDVATPGPVRGWAVDADGRLLQLSPDTRDVAGAFTGFGRPGSLAVTPNAGLVWISNGLDGELWRFDPHTLFSHALRGLGSPFTIALDPVDESAWVCDVAGLVRHYDPSGLPGAPASLPLLLEPAGVATDPVDRSVWVTERAGSRVRHYNRDGAPLGVRALSLPSRVAVDSATGHAWVTSLATGWVWHVSPAMQVLDSVQLDGPIGIAVDARRRIVWVADAAGNLLVALDPATGSVRASYVAPGEPRDVSVDAATGETWVAARVAGTVYRFSPTGVPLAQVSALGEVYEVKLDPGSE